MEVAQAEACRICEIGKRGWRLCAFDSPGRRLDQRCVFGVRRASFRVAALAGPACAFAGSTLGAARHLLMTGKARPAEIIAARQAGGGRALAALDRELETRPYLVGSTYSVADIAMYAYAHLADEAGVPLTPYPSVRAWTDRIRAQPDHLTERHPYDIDPHSTHELP